MASTNVAFVAQKGRMLSYSFIHRYILYVCMYVYTVYAPCCPAGSVILESPVLPVIEGDSVTLCCRSKALLSACSLRADFYKDGFLIGTTSTRNMTIHNVSKSHKGLYKCNIGGSGYSPESWLSVRGEKILVSVVFLCFCFNGH